MASILIADNLADRSEAGRVRSRYLRQCALEVAQSLHLDVTLLYVQELNKMILSNEGFQVLQKNFEDIKKSIIGEFKEHGVACNIEVLTGYPASEIINYVYPSSEYKLIIMGTHGKTGLERLFLGSVAEEVIRHSKIPVLVLGPEAQKSAKPFKINKDSKILLLTELSEASAAAESYALSLCLDLKCALHALYCLGDELMKTRSTLYGSGYVPFDTDKMFQEIIEQDEKLMDQKIGRWQKMGIDVTPMVTTKEEVMEDTFRSRVNRGYDLVVMGTHGRGRLLSSFIGSTARKAILTSPVPVIVIRGEEHR